MNSIAKTALLSFITTMLVACGGGSSDTQVETSNISVLSVSPEIFSTDVERDARISVKFNGQLLSTSVNSQSFQLRKGDELVAGKVSQSPVIMVGTDFYIFTPDNELDLLSIYHPRITTDIADIDGRPLASINAVEWEFKTRDGIWRERQKLAEGAVDKPLVIDGGDRLWSFHLLDNPFSGQSDIFASRLSEDGEWGSGKLVSNDMNDGNVSGSLNVKRLANGDLLVVWEELAEDGKDEIWYNRYHHASDSWGNSSRVTLDNTSKRNPIIVSNQSDSVFLQFNHLDNIAHATDLKVIGYSAADDQWLEEELIANDLKLASGEGQASIAMDSAGNMMATWFNNNLFDNSLHCRTRYYDATSQLWGNVHVFNQDNAGDAYLGTQIVVDSQDNFSVAWSQQHSLIGLPFIWSSRFTPGQGWSQPHQIIGSTLGYQPVMRVNKDNNIILTWLQDVVSGDDNLMFAGYNAEQDQWTNAALLEEEDNPVSQHSLVVDASGNFMAIWNQNRSGTFFDLQGNIALDPASIWVRRFDNSGDGEWLPASTISPIDGEVDKPVMAVNSSGEIMALWMQMIDGTATIQSRYFD